MFNGMPAMKAKLHGALRNARAGVLDKLDGLTDYDLRRTMPSSVAQKGLA